MRTQQFHYGWVVCFGCILLTVSTVGLLASSAFSLYLPYIASERGFSGTETSLIITVRSLSSILGMMLVRRYYNVFSYRTGISCAMLMAAAAFFLYGTANSLPVYCTGAAVAGLSYAFGSMIPVSLLINRWFRQSKGFAIGLASSGSGIGTLVFPSIITYFLEHYGLKPAFYAEAGMVFLMGVVVFIVLRNAPEECGLLPYGEDPAETMCADGGPKTSSISKTEERWMMSAMFFLGATGILSTANLSPLFANMGISSAHIAAAISMLGITLTLSKVFQGLSVDHFGPRNTTFLFGLSIVVGLLSCAFADRLPAYGIYAAALILGWGLPLATIGPPIWMGSFYSEEQYAPKLQRMQLIYQIGALLLSPLPGIGMDLTGSYVAAYIGMMLLTAYTMTVVICLYRRSAKTS